MVTATNLCRAACAVLLFISLPLDVDAQSAHANASGSRTARPIAHGVTLDCGEGLTLKINSGTAFQGGLLEASLDTLGEVGNLKADWAGKPVPLWTGENNAQHALIGVDLERAPGKYEFTVSGQLADRTPATCTAAIAVKPTQFAIESLKVAPGFVELSPEDRARADMESERVHQIFATLTPERLWNGRFRIPLTGSPAGHNFGKRRVLNGKPQSPHTGLDIPAPAGTPVHASQRGRVVLAENLFFSGNTVILDHGLGVYTFYGHLKSISVADGDEVKAGAVLGQVGATGRATGPHLHWSLVVDGARVNPLAILSLPLP